MNGHYATPFGAPAYEAYPGHAQQFFRQQQQHQEQSYNGNQSVYATPQDHLAEARAHLDSLFSGLSRSAAAAGLNAGGPSPSAGLNIANAAIYSSGGLPPRVSSLSNSAGLPYPAPTAEGHYGYAPSQHPSYSDHLDYQDRDWQGGYDATALHLPLPAPHQMHGQYLQHLQQPFNPTKASAVAWPNAGLAPSLHLSHSRQQLAQQQAFFNDHHADHQERLVQPMWQGQPVDADMMHGGSAISGENFMSSQQHQDYDSAKLHRYEGYVDENEAPTFNEYHDHPSFAKPPHKHAAQSRPTPVDAMRNFTAAGPIMPAATQDVPAEVSKVIADGASAIPPPPPLERSAHPLATLATELVWEAFLAAAGTNGGLGSSSPLYPTHGNRNGDRKVSPIRSRFDDASTSPISPQTPFSRRSQSKSISPAQHRASERSRVYSAGALEARGFGAIGGERRPRMANESPNSQMSSPASSAPGTPNMEGHTGWTVHTNDSQNALQRFGLGRESEDYAMTAACHGKDPLSLAPISNWARQVSSQSPMQSRQQSAYTIANGNNVSQASPPPPAALFDQIRNLLGATLLSQQVLLLALYFVVKIPHTSPLYPPATSQSALSSTSAPFKLLLAALVVANKHLDDNSFRNSTFATVSGITLPEVNALEYSLLNALNFDVNVDSKLWLTWLRDLEQQQAGIGNENTVITCSIIRSIIEGVLGQQCEQTLARLQQRHPTSLSACVSLASSPVISIRSRKHSLDMPLTPVTPRSDNSFDMDAAGPLELRPRYSKASQGIYNQANYQMPYIPYGYGAQQDYEGYASNFYSTEHPHAYGRVLVA